MSEATRRAGVMARPDEAWTDLLRCPHDGAPVRWSGPGHAGWVGELWSDGALDCVVCGVRFAAVDGIVRFITGSLDDERKMAEMRARDETAEGDAPQAGVHDPGEERALLAALRPSGGDTVVDLGCGTGRLTLQYAARVERTVAIDFSLASLRVLQRRLPEAVRRRILLVQADVCALPVARGAFTKAVSSQVLEHLPTREMREGAVRSIASLLVPGGSFTCTVYNWSWHKQGLARRGVETGFADKEGMHSSNIYYYNFEASEFAQLIEVAGMRVELMRGVTIGFPGARLLGPVAGPLKRLITRTSLGVRLAHLLLCHARRPNLGAPDMGASVRPGP